MKIKYFYFFHVINVIESGIIVGVKKFIVKDFIIWLWSNKFKMGYRNDCQDSLKLEQFVKNILYRYMDIMFDFLNMVMFQNTVSSLKICYKKHLSYIYSY